MLTIKQIAKSLKKYFISGSLHNAINITTTNIYKMFTAFSGVFKREYDSEEYLKIELNPETTHDLITYWEKFAGIPDCCFEQTGSIEQRRNQVITKLTANVQTKQDFIDLAAKLGVTVTITSKAEQFAPFPFQFPFQFGGSVEDFFIIIVDIIGWEPTGGFAYQFPFQFGFDEYSSQVQCLFDKLKPANCKIEYI